MEDSLLAANEGDALMSMEDRDRPVALVTGPTSGIGRVYAQRLAARGHDLVLVARDAARLDGIAAELRDRHGVAVDVLAVDLSTDDGTTTVVEHIHRTPVDVLVNNAGFGTTGTIHRTDAARQEAMVRLHALAPMRLTQAALPAMVARGSGSIINVASVASFLASPGNANYCATKAYLRVFAESIALEVAGTGVRVQALCPGFTHTEFHARAAVDKSRLPAWMWMDAERVVDESLAALDRGGPVVCIPGASYRLIVLLTRLVPRWLLARGARRYRRD